MVGLRAGDYLEIRDSEGETIYIQVLIHKIEGDIIHTEYGRYRIVGSKNGAGEETFTPILEPNQVDSGHAVKWES